MGKQNYNLPSLDLEMLLNKGIAVVCYEKEEAEILIECMLREMPDYMSGWEDHNTHWNHEPTIYTLWWYNNFEWVRGKRNSLMQGTLRMYKNGGYTLVALRDLFLQVDIEESDFPIEFLLC